VQCLPVPKGLTDIEAASLPETFFTVWSNVFERAHLGKGENGAEETLADAGRVERHRRDGYSDCEGAGASRVRDGRFRREVSGVRRTGCGARINYNTEDFVDVVKSLTNDRGVDVILDMVAGDYLPRELKALADGGRVVVIATLGGSKAEIDLNEVLRRRLTVTGSTLRPRSVEFKGRVAVQLKTQVWPEIEAGRIKPVIHQVFPADQAAAAHALMESSTHIGKIMLDWSQVA
jgi:NADPH2:quinone reductase